jgi:hypothetical protein
MQGSGVNPAPGGPPQRRREAAARPSHVTISQTFTYADRASWTRRSGSRPDGTCRDHIETIPPHDSRADHAQGFDVCGLLTPLNAGMSNKQRGRRGLTPASPPSQRLYVDEPRPSQILIGIARRGRAGAGNAFHIWTAESAPSPRRRTLRFPSGEFIRSSGRTPLYPSGFATSISRRRAVRTSDGCGAAAPRAVPGRRGER